MPNTKHILAVLCASIGGFLSIYSTQAIYPALHARFHIDSSQAGALVTATALGIAVSALFTPSLISKIGTERSLLSSLLVLAVLWVFMSVAPDWYWLMFIRLLQGLVISVALSSLLTSIHNQYSGYAATRASATYIIGTVLGGTAGRYLPAVMMPALDWTGTTLLISLVHLLLWACVWLFITASLLTITQN